MERKNNSPEVQKIKMLDEQYHEYLLLGMLESQKKIEGYIPDEIIQKEEYEVSNNINDPYSETSVQVISNTITGGIIGAFQRLASHKGLILEHQSCYEITVDDAQLMEMKKKLSEKYYEESILKSFPAIITLLRTIRDDEKIFEISIGLLMQQNINIDYLVPVLFYLQKNGNLTNLQASFFYNHTNREYIDFHIFFRGEYHEESSNIIETSSIEEELSKLLIEARKNNRCITFNPVKKGNKMIVEEKIYYTTDEIKFIDISTKHPHSKVHTSVYKGKIQGYEVIVKTELHKSEK